MNTFFAFIKNQRCFAFEEGGVGLPRHTCPAYDAQVAQAQVAQAGWNRKMARLYADRGRSVRRAAPSPSYRTQAQVTARCHECGSCCDADIAALRDRTFAKAYRDFLTALKPEGQHWPPLGQPASRWRVVPLADLKGECPWTLRLASEMRLVVEKFVKAKQRGTKGAWVAVQEGDGSPAIDEAFEREARAGGWVRLRDLNYRPYLTETPEILRKRWSG